MNNGDNAVAVSIKQRDNDSQWTKHYRCKLGVYMTLLALIQLFKNEQNIVCNN